MLMSPGTLDRTQVLEDLLAVRERIEKNWAKEAWQVGDNACLVGSIQLAVGVDVGRLWIAGDTQDPAEVRFGRIITLLYRTLCGPNTPLNVSLSDAVDRLIGFNDSEIVDHGGVLLLLDRAIQLCMEPVAANS
jgi:hypothetical protein